MTTGPSGPLGFRDATWEERGRLAAQQLAGVSAAVVVGASPLHAAQVAVGIARAECQRRHVALGDLTGDLSPLYEIAGGEDAVGLSDCLRDGRPLNDIARAAPDSPSLFILPAGTSPVATEAVLAHERWPRLVKGFAQAGALLLLVAPPDAPGLDALVAATDGVIAVDMPAQWLSRHPAIVVVEARRHRGAVRPRTPAGEMDRHCRRRFALAVRRRVVALDSPAQRPRARSRRHGRGRDDQSEPDGWRSRRVAGSGAGRSARGHSASHRSCQPGRFRGVDSILGRSHGGEHPRGCKFVRRQKPRDASQCDANRRAGCTWRTRRGLVQSDGRRMAGPEWR